MIIFNTTFHIEEKKQEDFLKWLKETYIPQATESGLIYSPQLCRILSQQEDEEGYAYSLQFKTESTANLHKWFTAIGSKLDNEAVGIFGHKVTKFSTLLEVIQ